MDTDCDGQTKPYMLAGHACDEQHDKLMNEVKTQIEKIAVPRAGNPED